MTKVPTRAALDESCGVGTGILKRASNKVYRINVRNPRQEISLALAGWGKIVAAYGSKVFCLASRFVNSITVPPHVSFHFAACFGSWRRILVIPGSVMLEVFD